MAISKEFKVGLPADHDFQDGPQNGRRSMELLDMQQLSSFSTHFTEISCMQHRYLGTSSKSGFQQLMVSKMAAKMAAT